MHVIVHNVASDAVVQWVDDIVESIVLISIQIGSTTSVAREVDEQRIVRLGVLDEPLHGAYYVRLGGDAHRIPLVIGENDHVLTLVPVPPSQEVGHVSNIIDTAFECIGLPCVVDPDQQSPAATGTIRVLEPVVRGSTSTKLLRIMGWGWGQIRRVWTRISCQRLVTPPRVLGIEVYHSAGHSEYAGVREDEEVEWGRMAGIEEDTEDIEAEDTEGADTEVEIGDKLMGRGNDQDPNKMIGVDDRRAEEDTAEAEAAIGEVVDILPMGEALVLEVDPSVDNSSLQRCDL